MDFEQLRIFMVLAEEGTYLGAANRIATSRSRVRRKLDQLEHEAGTPLIYRDQGILRPTPAGEVLVRRGSELLDDADQLPALKELARLCRSGGEIRLLDYVLPEHSGRRRSTRRTPSGGSASVSWNQASKTRSSKASA